MGESNVCLPSPQARDNPGIIATAGKSGTPGDLPQGKAYIELMPAYRAPKGT